MPVPTATVQRPARRESLLNEQAPFDATQAGPAMQTIRRRRWYLWWVILVYVPAMWVTMQVKPTYLVVGTVFVVWIILLFIAGIYSALARCPRCGNYFHMHGMTLLYLRKCLHCQLHINADRKRH
jgi:hypothetical protein